LVIALGACHPVHDVGDDGGDVDVLELEVWEVVDGATLIKVRDVDKVPAALPGATFALDLVSEE
jgi:hypothetical protein